MNNGTGLTLNNNATVNQTLTFTAGRITTGAAKVVIGAAGGVSGAGGSSYVAGKLEKLVTVSAGAFTQTFEVGDATTYAPVTITQDAAAAGPSGTVIASTTAGDHPQIGTSPINPARSVNRFWTLTNNGLGFGEAVFNFASRMSTPAQPRNFGGAVAHKVRTVGTRTYQHLASGIDHGRVRVGGRRTDDRSAEPTLHRPVGAVTVPVAALTTVTRCLFRGARAGRQVSVGAQRATRSRASRRPRSAPPSAPTTRSIPASASTRTRPAPPVGHTPSRDGRVILRPA
jgi:hypothetical protein